MYVYLVVRIAGFVQEYGKYYLQCSLGQCFYGHRIEECLIEVGESNIRSLVVNEFITLEAIPISIVGHKAYFKMKKFRKV